MRWCFPFALAVLVACGGTDEPPTEPLEVPPIVEAPTPPPLPPTEDLNTLLPQEPAFPPGTKPPAKTPAHSPALEPSEVPSGAKTLMFDKVVLASSVVDRTPRGEGTSFKNGTKVFCWMAVTNPGSKRRLSHQWFHNGTRKSNIPVKIGGPTWRTWTARPVYTTGAWRVDIVDENGRVLHSVAFEVE